MKFSSKKLLLVAIMAASLPTTVRLQAMYDEEDYEPMPRTKTASPSELSQSSAYLSRASRSPLGRSQSSESVGSTGSARSTGSSRWSDEESQTAEDPRIRAFNEAREAEKAEEKSFIQKRAQARAQAKEVAPKLQKIFEEYTTFSLNPNKRSKQELLQELLSMNIPEEKGILNSLKQFVTRAKGLNEQYKGTYNFRGERDWTAPEQRKQEEITALLQELNKKYNLYVLSLTW